MMKSIGKFAVACSLAGIASGAFAAPITLTFEGLRNGEAINNFYNGGTGSLGSSGVNYGVSFSSDSLALIDSDAGGTGNFANEPSASTIMFFTANSAVLNYAAGFTGGFSFFYTTLLFAGSVDVYDGINRTGNKLGSIAVNALGSGCVGDPTGQFCNWAAAGVSFSGTAKSIDFGGTASQVGFDNITIGSSTPGVGGTGGSVPEPGSLALIGAALLALRAVRRS